jgi:hypothetical protein
MISFKGVTPQPAPKPEPPEQIQRMSIQEPAPQVDAPQMKKQLSQDTVSFSGGAYRTEYGQNLVGITVAKNFKGIKGNAKAEAALENLKTIVKQDKRHNAQEAFTEKRRDLLERIMLGLE